MSGSELSDYEETPKQPQTVPVFGNQTFSSSKETDQKAILIVDD